MQARAAAMTENNVKEGFLNTGLVPPSLTQAYLVLLESQDLEEEVLT
jgi:hypothetical protein